MTLTITLKTIAVWTQIQKILWKFPTKIAKTDKNLDVRNRIKSHQLFIQQFKIYKNNAFKKDSDELEQIVNIVAKKQCLVTTIAIIIVIQITVAAVIMLQMIIIIIVMILDQMEVIQAQQMRQNQMDAVNVAVSVGYREMGYETTTLKKEKNSLKKHKNQYIDRCLTQLNSKHSNQSSKANQTYLFNLGEAYPQNRTGVIRFPPRIINAHN